MVYCKTCGVREDQDCKSNEKCDFIATHENPEEDRLIDELRIAQGYLRAELGSDWNDLCKVLYEGRVLAAMYRYKHNKKSN